MKLKKLIVVLQATLVLLGALSIWWLTARAGLELQGEILRQTRIVAEAISLDHLRALEGTEADLAKPEYLLLKEKFAAIRQTSDRYRFIYLMGSRDGEALFFFVDDTPVGHKDESPAGQVYADAPDEFRRVMETGIAAVVGPYSDRWGTFVSACVPLADKQTGKILALLAVDLDATAWKREVAARVALPVGLVLVLLIGMITVLAAMGRTNSSPKPVLRRLLPPLAAMVVLLLAGAAILLWQQYQSAMDKRMATLNASIAAEFQVDLRNQSALLAMALQSIVVDPRVVQGLREGDRHRLLADWQAVFEKLRRDHALTHLTFIDKNRTLLLRVHQPEPRGGRIDRFTVKEAERTGQAASGIEVGQVGTLVLRVVQPVFHGGQLLGYVELGKGIEDVLHERYIQSGSHLAVTIHKQHLDRRQWEKAMALVGQEARWDRLADSAIIYASQGHLPDAFVAVTNHHPETGHLQGQKKPQVKVGSQHWRISTSPLQDAAGQEIGCILVMNDISAEKSLLFQTLTMGGIFGGVVLTSLLSFILVLLRRTDEGIRLQQAELRQSEERLSATLASIGDGVISTDGAGRVVSLNGVAEDLTGWGSLEAFGRPIEEVFDIVNAQTRVLVENPVEQCLREGLSVELANHTLLIRRDGTECHIADSCAPIRDTLGAIIGAVLVFRDVTLEYRYRQELREERERLAGVLWATGVGTWEWNIQTGETHFNDRWAEMIGYSLAEISPVSIKTWGQYLHPDDQPIADQALQRHFRGETDYYECEFRMGHRTGDWIWVLARGKVSSWTEDGQPLWMAGTHLEITDRRQAEEKRRLSEELLQSVFRVAPTGIGLVGDRVFLEINQRICDMTGYSPEELIGKNSQLLYPSQEDYDFVGKVKYAQIKATGTGIVETRWRRKDGTFIDVLLSSAPLNPADLSQGVTFTALDITARRRVENALRESERKLSSWMGNLPGMAYRCRNDQNWTMEFISDGCHALTGYVAEDLKAFYADIIHPEDREYVWQTVQAALEEKKPFHLEFRIRTARGEERWVWEQGVGIFADGNQPEALEGIIVDITDHKRAEEALTESEARYRSLFENNHAVMLVLDPVSGTIIDANPAAASWYGWSRDELCAKNICEINMLSQKDLQAEFQRARSQQNWHFLFRHRRADGSLRDVEVFSGPVKVAGRSLLYSIVHDITDKKHAEEALEKRMVALTRPLDDTTSITFEELFNLGDIQRLQNDFAQAAGVASMIVAPDGVPITASSNFSRLCQDFVRSTEKGQVNCCRSDVAIGKPSARGPTIRRCLSAGLWEAGAAILVGGHHVASWLVGQVRDATQTEDQMRIYAREIGADENAMVEAFREIPVMSSEQFGHVAQALYTLANQLSLSAYQNVQQARFITEQKRDQDKIAFLAHHDQLTGLANRTLFVDRFAQAAGHASRTSTEMALCVLDLDGFKAINDTHGHPLGDHLLCEVAKRLKDAVRTSDTVCRIGGDEFAVLFTDLQEPSAVHALIKKIFACFEAPFKLVGALHSISASVGVAVFPEDGTEFSTLFENADAAMYYAKESGRNNVQFFHQEINHRVQHRLTIEKELRQALLEDQLELHYQPIIQLPEKRLAGMEALVRWRHPQKGLILPGQFIPVAEESNLIVLLGQWVIKAACRDMAAWRTLGLPELPVSVNVSARQLFEKNFAAFVGQTLIEDNLPAHQLELEVTENIFLESSDSVEAVMNELKDIGVGLILDDFGTGYSSLSYLKRFRIEKLKIDRSFMEQVCHNQQDAILVTTIIRMAQSLGMKVVAEGVETAEQMEFLTAQGCELAQGFFFSKPLPLAAVQELLSLPDSGHLTLPTDTMSDPALFV